MKTRDSSQVFILKLKVLPRYASIDGKIMQVVSGQAGYKGFLYLCLRTKRMANFVAK